MKNHYTVVVVDERGRESRLNCQANSCRCSGSTGGSQSKQTNPVNPVRLNQRQIDDLRDSTIYLKKGRRAGQQQQQ